MSTKINYEKNGEFFFERDSDVLCENVPELGIFHMEVGTSCDQCDHEGQYQAYFYTEDAEAEVYFSKEEALSLADCSLACAKEFLLSLM